MLRTFVRAAVVATGSVAMVGAGAVLSAAAACGETGCGGGSGSGSTQTDGGTVTVHVTGSFVGGGSGGSSGSSSTTVAVPVPCWYFATETGKELYDRYGEDGMVTLGGPHEPSVPASEYYPGYKQHKDDDEGSWYAGVCSGAAYEDLGYTGDFLDFAEDWFRDRGPVYVQAGQTPPVPPVPPEVLLQAAEDAMTVPEPRFEMNPRYQGDAITVVNLETWFWTDASIPTAGSVTASAGANSVTVDITREGVEFASPSAGSVLCTDGGTPYAQGENSDCTLTFRRSAAATPVTASTLWHGTWSFNGAPQGAIDPLTSSWSDDIGVGEVQSIVTRAD
ncbi:hypothetical protein CLV56_3453 [Mumia flava]|uniref:Ig-like domain-containing protein n=1 Tax=Mumia flava TaxID=1348852 RepID=A0A0B2BB00_9ACTN|nr:hypothetical protein [Mumia flava]PJJ53951.1 hypothetical protein CLV56_3453 [Mumia flava]